MRREINSKMLKKGQQKSSTRLGDRVIVRERMEYKGHHHVQKPRAFCKGRTVNERCGVIGMCVPWTQVKKKGTERSIPCMLEENSWISMRGQVTGTSHSDFHPRLWMTVERLVLAKFARMTWRSEWIPHLEKFSENALWASSSRNQRERGAESKDEEASEWREF